MEWKPGSIVQVTEANPFKPNVGRIGDLVSQMSAVNHSTGKEECGWVVHGRFVEIDNMKEFEGEFAFPTKYLRLISGPDVLEEKTADRGVDSKVLETV